MRLASITLMTAITGFAGSSSSGEEKQVQLREAPGLDKVESQCGACHSLDYVQMNSRFLSAAGWEAEIAKMINAFGAQIDQADAKTIADYLNKNYGIESSSLEKDQGIAKPTSSTPGPSFKLAGAVKRVAKHAKTSHAQVQSVAPAPPAAPTLTLEERQGPKMGM
jgi:sulfite dehydrogenase (cytochrome) subunit B